MNFTSVKRLFFLCLVLLLSCGKGYKEKEYIQYEVASGRFKATLKSLNPSVGVFHGWVSLSIEDYQFWARIKVMGPNSKDMHAQYIHTSGTCPLMRDDTNHDGYLDFIEASKVVGPILVPLDSNLNSQMFGLNEFPIMRNKNDFYYYSEACNAQRMMLDLRREDYYETDMISKLSSGEDLNLEKRIVMIYGVPLERALPSTVRSFDGYPSQASLPIACGEIMIGESDGFSLK
jgi:hypothetical protein